MPNEEERTPPSFEQRLDALTSALEAEAREREKADTAFHARMEALARRHEALTLSLELMAHESEAQRLRSERDSEALNALVRIAEIHKRRLTDLEGPRPQ